MPPSLATSQYPGADNGLMPIVRTSELERWFASVTVNLTGYRPEMVGIPLIIPCGLSLSPGGRFPPVTAQEYGASPPTAASGPE